MRALASLMLALMLGVPALVRAQDAPRAPSDYAFPGAERLALGAATGIPYVGIAELSYGFGDRFALGVIGGATPRVWGFGLRPRGVFFEVEALRAFAVMPAFYYPVTNGPGAEPWVLAYPSARLELRAAPSVRVHAGIGLIAAACVNELFGRDEHQAAHHAAVEEGEPMFGVWNTLLVGGALQLSAHAHLYAEASLVLEGVRVAPATWIGGPPPVVAQLGTSWTF